MMLVGFFVGGLLGFGLAMANDMCRLRKQTSAAAQQKVGLKKCSLPYDSPIAVCPLPFWGRPYKGRTSQLHQSAGQDYLYGAAEEDRPLDPVGGVSLCQQQCSAATSIQGHHGV